MLSKLPAFLLVAVARWKEQRSQIFDRLVKSEGGEAADSVNAAERTKKSPFLISSGSAGKVRKSGSAYKGKACQKGKEILERKGSQDSFQWGVRAFAWRPGQETPGGTQSQINPFFQGFINLFPSFISTIPPSSGFPASFPSVCEHFKSTSPEATGRKWGVSFLLFLCWILRDQ